MLEKKENPQVRKIDYEQLLLSSTEFSLVLRSVLARGIQVRFQARGNSMIPFIRDGDILTIAPTDTIIPAIGKVVAYNQAESQSLIVHRIIGKKGLNFLIRGDNSVERSDCWIHTSELLGCVIVIERNQRRIKFGLGIERYAIALLSRYSLLTKISRRMVRLFK